MLSPNAVKCVYHMLSIGCNIIGYLPYKWNHKTLRLELGTSWHQVLVYRANFLLQFCVAIWGYSRFLWTLQWDDVPIRIRTINFLWCLAYTLTQVCYLQFYQRKRQIMDFANMMLTYMRNNPRRDDEYVNGNGKRRDIVSMCVLFGGFLLYVNPPAHAALMIESPCVPHFLSSVFFPCDKTNEDTERWFQKIPFFLVEMYIVGVLLALWSFNWTMIFLGLAWVRRELKGLRRDTSERTVPLTTETTKAFHRYREFQQKLGALNASFQLYLAWFPAILLGLIACTFFAVFKFTYLAPHSYLMFPACGARCFFETLTPLALAGIVYEQSDLLLKDWKWFGGTRKDSKYLSIFHKSCHILRLTAGSLYTFEAAILIVTINAVAQLTTNMLLMFKDVPGE